MLKFDITTSFCEMLIAYCTPSIGTDVNHLQFHLAFAQLLSDFCLLFPTDIGQIKCKQRIRMLQNRLFLVFHADISQKSKISADSSIKIIVCVKQNDFTKIR